MFFQRLQVASKFMPVSSVVVGEYYVYVDKYHQKNNENLSFLKESFLQED